LNFRIPENDLVSRQIVNKQLTPFVEVDCPICEKDTLTSVNMAIGHNPTYDLICLDIIKPQVDGFTVLKKSGSWVLKRVKFVYKIEENHNFSIFQRKERSIGDPGQM
jgi:CheY-like chemotaxis protein